MAARPFTVVAIVSAYNEADVIGSVLDHLIEQGVSVYVLDHHSTDNTGGIARERLGRGVLDVESFPSAGAERTDTFTWAAILRRKLEIADGLDADWIIHHDADEFREGPWPSERLVAAIARVDALGYNAIDFAVLNFHPTDNLFEPGDDPRFRLRHFAPPEAFDRLQIKCWKKGPAVDLISTGGHEAAFDGRRVFPLRFVLRHYPIRSQRHGERKVFQERRPRVVPEERQQGWHVQYDAIAPGHTFVRERETLTQYEPDAIRMALILEHRGVEAVNAQLAVANRLVASQAQTLDAARSALRAALGDARCLRVEVETTTAALAVERERNRELEALFRRLEADLAAGRSQLRGQERIIEQLVMDESRRQQEIDRLRAESSALLTSRTWRYTWPARWLYEHLIRSGLARRMRL